MPRRNNRTRMESDNAANLGDAYKFTRDPVLAEQRAEDRRRRRESASANMRSLTERSVSGECVAPGCGLQVLKQLGVGINFPMCVMHMVAIWEAVESKSHEPWFEPAVTALKARQDIHRRERLETDAADQAEWRAALKERNVMGDMYFVRVDDLIKVGWSSNLEGRLRAYGPTAQVLCHYPATQRDETLLHQQLTPFRAKGREWYHDTTGMRGFVAEVIERYGPPLVAAKWTEHKGATKPKRWSA